MASRAVTIVRARSATPGPLYPSVFPIVQTFDKNTYYLMIKHLKFNTLQHLFGGNGRKTCTFTLLNLKICTAVTLSDTLVPIPREVFGVSNGGHDFHFTYTGRNAEGVETFKLGLGDGSLPSNNNNNNRRRPPTALSFPTSTTRSIVTSAV